VRNGSIALPALRGLFVGAVTVVFLGAVAAALVLCAGPGPGPVARGGSLRGVIELDPAIAAQRVGPDACVYLAVRRLDEPQAPPLLTRRLPADFPVAFEVGIGDSMLGEALPRELLVAARLDTDGDPLTHAPGEPSAILEGVRASDLAELRLVLR
jgi:hypothetical protein